MATSSAYAQAPRPPKPTLASLSEGRPVFMGTALPEISYVPVAVRKLARARLVWFNPRLARDKGLEVPDGPLSATQQNEITDALAYLDYRPGDPEDAFSSTTRTLYADRYGHRKFGNQFGSGRAASGGIWNWKGILTPLTSDNASPDYRTGMTALESIIRESVWGEVAHHHLPHGANRVFAVFDCGFERVLPDGTRTQVYIMIREDSLRPANYIRAHNAVGSWQNSEAQRMAAVMGFIDQALPVPPELRNAPRGQRVYHGLFEYVRRLAQQRAAMERLGIYHAADTSSNSMLPSGGLIDYATMTAQRGHIPIQVPTITPPFGDYREVRELLVHDLIEEIREYASKEVRDALPATPELLAFFDRTMTQERTKAYLSLTGAPLSIIDELLGTPASDAMARALITIANEGPLHGWAPTVLDHPTYEDWIPHLLSRILPVTARALSSNGLIESKIDRLAQQLNVYSALTPCQDRWNHTAQCQDPRHWLRTYSNYMAAVYRAARARGAGPAKVTPFIREAAVRRNRKLSGLNLGPFIGEIYRTIDMNSAAAVAHLIDSRISENLFADDLGEASLSLQPACPVNL